jgi:hypothetical protein
MPGIVFDAGDPGVSSVKTLEIAVKAVADKGLIDENESDWSDILGAIIKPLTP